jgi:prophage tail gpP-like protein
VPDIAIRVNGKEYRGWKSGRVSRRIDGVSGDFELTVSDKWAGQDQAWEIREEDECQILLGGEVVLTGSVDEREVDLSGDEHTVTIRGRDRAAFLVDNSAELDDWEFRGPDLMTFLGKVAGVGGPIQLGSGASAGERPPKFSVAIGDTRFQVLDRAARFLGLLPVSDGRGTVQLLTPGKDIAPVSLVEGQNVLRGRSRYAAAERFSRVVVMGQYWGEDEEAHSVKVTATDPNVKRKDRVLILQAEGSVSRAAAEKRAKWEVAVRAARAESVSPQVRGWRHSSGLWTPGWLVPVELPVLGATGRMLIQQVDSEISVDGGELSTLTLVRPDAYLPEPAPAGGWKL